jgi:hypothetical protein
MSEGKAGGYRCLELKYGLSVEMATQFDIAWEEVTS